MPNASWRRWGVATARGGGSPILETRAKRQVERTERSGGLHKRSAEAWGHPLRARGAKLPLGDFVVAFREIRQALRASSDGERELAPQRGTSPRNQFPQENKEFRIGRKERPFLFWIECPCSVRIPVVEEENLPLPSLREDTIRTDQGWPIQWEALDAWSSRGDRLLPWSPRRNPYFARCHISVKRGS
jgi:hypothetical protein